MKSTRENNVEKYLRGCERNLENPQTDRIFSKYIKRIHLKEETLKFSNLLVSVLHREVLNMSIYKKVDSIGGDVNLGLTIKMNYIICQEINMIY